MTFPSDQFSKSSPKLYVNKTQLTELIISIKAINVKSFYLFRLFRPSFSQFMKQKSITRFTVRCGLNNDGADSFYFSAVDSKRGLDFLSLCVGWKKVFKLLQSSLLTIKRCHVI